MCSLRIRSWMLPTSTKLIYHLAHETTRRRQPPKYQQVYSALSRRDISRAGWNVGTGCRARRSSCARSGRRGSPSGGRCGTCRRRAGRAAGGLRAPSWRARSAPGALSFGLLIPDLGETDIFEPDLSGHDGVAAGARARARLGQPERRRRREGRSTPGSCAGSTSSAASRACSSRRSSSRRDKTTSTAGLRRPSTTPGIPVVLLDRTVMPYPRRGHHDLVGIDNRRAGYVITEHLLRLGSERVAFVALPNAAATVDAREAGYREALYAAGVPGRSRPRPPARSGRHRLCPSVDGVCPSRRHRLRQRPHRGAG